MDDVRIFSKDIETARRAIFDMDAVLRSLHLNVQSAKTKLLAESRREITHALIDNRLDELNDICDQIATDKKDGNLTKGKKKDHLRRLKRVADREPESPEEKKISGARTPLSGLSLRVFRRWISAHSLLDSQEFTDPLMREIIRNPDHRLTRRVISTARRFPRRSRIGNQIFDFIRSDLNIFPHQEAELIHALRYLSRISEEILEYCEKNLIDENSHFYVRIQSAYLLAHRELDLAKIDKIKKLFDEERNLHVQAAMTYIFTQYRGHKNRDILRVMAFHPNPKVQGIGKRFAFVKNDIKTATSTLKFIFKPNYEMRICDLMTYVFLMSQSKNEEIVRLVMDNTDLYRKSHSVMDVRGVLENIYRRCAASLN